MSYLNISPDLFLEKLELTRFQEYLGDQGHARLLRQLTATAGLIKFHNQLEFLNGFTQEDLSLSNGTKTLKVLEIKAFDLQGRYIYRPLSRQVPIPQRNTWYWLKLKHDYTTVESGSFSIDIYGTLTSSVPNLLTIFRGQPNFPTRIKFENSANNVFEYDVLQVVDSQHAVLNGYFVAEDNLTISIVGTFTPGVVKSDDEKYPFRQDYSELTLVEEVTLNAQPVSIGGTEFYLARVRWSDNQVTVQDKRTQIWQTNSEASTAKLYDNINPVFGIEAVKNKNGHTFQEASQVELAWSVRFSNWTIDPSSNTLTIYGIFLGGRFKKISDFTNNDFDGWLLFSDNGQKSKIISSIKKGDSINLKLDVLDISNFTINGGLDLLDQELLICPNCQSIELYFYPTDDTVKNSSVRVSYPINTALAKINLPIYQEPSCVYGLKYRYFSNKEYGVWKTPLSDEVGYFSEVNFDDSGDFVVNNLQVLVPYETLINLGWLTLNASDQGVRYYKNLLAKNINDAEQFVIPSTDSFKTLIIDHNKTVQLILNSSSLSPLTARQFLNLDLDQAISGSRFELILGPEVIIGAKELVITQGFVPGQSEGQILKVLSDRDFRVARDLKTCLSIQLIFTGIAWICVPSYVVGPKFELTLYHGNTSDAACFDSTGLGVGSGWLGFSICNGNNGTSNIIGAPAGSVYVKRMY